MFIDIDCSQVRKHDQNAHGDFFFSKRKELEGRILAVLSDGLGSGIKANILSCMTATMLLRFIEEEVPIQQAAQIVMNALPVCQVRKISYATFSALDCSDDGSVWIVEEGNPEFIWMRQGRELVPSYHEVVSKDFPERILRVYQLKAELNDRLIFCSDGVTQAGLGAPRYPLGWKRSGLLDCLRDILSQTPDMSSRQLSQHIIQQALACEPLGAAGDDISSVVLYFREPRQSLIFTGPPYDKTKDNEYSLVFDDFDGPKAICGGTTANLIARELDREITTPKGIEMGSLPPIACMEGVDLVTEGIITLTKTLEYLEKGELTQKDAGGLLVDFLLNSDVIEFMVGAMLNQAHYDPTLPIEIEIRRNIIKKMKTVLEEKYLKRVLLHYI